MYVIVWRFTVKREHIPEFVKNYGPEGTWSRFFRRSPKFDHTDLLANGTDFLTLDWWQSKADFIAFERTNHDEYRRIDRGFERLTEREERVGEFEVR